MVVNVFVIERYLPHVPIQPAGHVVGLHEAEERQGRITGSQQEGIADGRHIDDAAWPHSLERQSYDAKHIVHGCKGTKNSTK